MTNIMESLQAEFPFEQLGWKITHTFESQGRFFAYVAPFVDARAIQDRFDEVFYGVGIHGEKGYRKEALSSSEILAIELMNKLKSIYR